MRAHLHTEWNQALRHVSALINEAKSLFSQAESSARKLASLGEDPTHVNQAGEERYKKAGQLLYQAMTEIMGMQGINDLDVDGIEANLADLRDNGAIWPTLVILGCPREFDVIHGDLHDTGAGTLGNFTAKNFYDNSNPNPFSELTAGHTIKFLQADFTTDAVGPHVEGMEATINSIAVDGNSNWYLRLNEDLKDAVEATAGEEVQSGFEIRRVDNGITP